MFATLLDWVLLDDVTECGVPRDEECAHGHEAGSVSVVQLVRKVIVVLLRTLAHDAEDLIDHLDSLSHYSLTHLIMQMTHEYFNRSR